MEEPPKYSPRIARKLLELKDKLQPIETEFDTIKGAAYLREFNAILKNNFIETIQNNLYFNPLPLKCHDIRLGPSLTHGLGLFSTAKIAAKTVITYFPAHGIYDNDEKKFITVSCELEKYRADYSFTLPGGRYQIVGNPEKTDNPLLLGHMINDANSNPFNLDETVIQTRNGIARYMSNLNKNNCRPGMKSGTLIYIMTCRDIEEGEELLMAYGPAFWYCLTTGKRFPLEIIDEKMQKFIGLQREKLEHLGYF